MLTVLHVRGKFGGGGYAVCGDLHGGGLAPGHRGVMFDETCFSRQHCYFHATSRLPPDVPLAASRPRGS